MAVSLWGVVIGGLLGIGGAIGGSIATALSGGEACPRSD